MSSSMVRHSMILVVIVSAVSCGGEIPDAETTTNAQIEVLLTHNVDQGETGELPGQTWQAGSVTFSFQRGNHVLVRGGHITETMPTGAPGRYSLESEVLKLDVLGRVYEGTWDGETLTLNGHHATYLGLTETIYPDSVLDYPPQPKEESPDVKENP